MSLEVDVRKLDLFNRMAKEGSNTVADHLSQLAGLDAGIDVSKINFMALEDVKTHLGDQKEVGIFVELVDPPHGYVLFLMDPEDSKELVGEMVGGMGDGDGPSDGLFTEMERSAMQEIGNIMTSGYIDGWANVLDTTIDISTPSFVYGPASDIVEKMGGWPDEDIVFVVDSDIVAADTDVELTAYTFPRLEELVSLIKRIDLDTDVEADTEASSDIID
jgi:chemotaxis protein CheC